MQLPEEYQRKGERSYGEVVAKIRKEGGEYERMIDISVSRAYNSDPFFVRAGPPARYTIKI